MYPKSGKLRRNTMTNLLKLKMFICKLLTFWIIPSKRRKLARDFLFWFSYSDYVRFKNMDYHVVSLGSRCLTRALAVAVGIKPRRFYGEKSCPFDLYVSDLKRNIELIENDFSDFFENINLTKFPHDDKLTLLQFKKCYKKRIQNFLDIQQCDKKVYYIYSNYETIPCAEDITKLYKVLKAKRNGKPFELIILTKQHINVPDVIQIPYDTGFYDHRTVEYIINKYKKHKNYSKYTKFMGKELRRVIK